MKKMLYILDSKTWRIKRPSLEAVKDTFFTTAKSGRRALPHELNMLTSSEAGNLLSVGVLQAVSSGCLRSLIATSSHLYFGE